MARIDSHSGTSFRWSSSNRAWLLPAGVTVITASPCRTTLWNGAFHHVGRREHPSTLPRTCEVKAGNVAKGRSWRPQRRKVSHFGPFPVGHPRSEEHTSELQS